MTLRHPVLSFRLDMSYVAMCCSVLQCVAVSCSAMQCIAVCCSVLQCVAVCFDSIMSYVCWQYRVDIWHNDYVIMIVSLIDVIIMPYVWRIDIIIMP